MTRSSAKLPIIIVLVLLLVGVMVAVLASRDTRDGASSLAHPPEAYVHGASLEEWTARHWQWTLSMPVGGHPGQDASGDACLAGQSGPVLFMPRNLPPCTVPEGATILLPISGGECSSVEQDPFSGDDEQALRNCAAQEADRYVNVSVTVDGEHIPNIDAYRTSTPLLPVALPEHNVLGAAPGLAWSVADGHMMLLRPMEPGEHTIIVHTETIDGVVLPDKMLELTVAEPAWEAPASPPAQATPAEATPMASPVTD